MTRSRGRGLTLVELLVVIALLGLLTGMSAFMAAGALEPAAGTEAPLDSARRQAILTGVPVTVEVFDTALGAPRSVRFLPDGRVVTETVGHVWGHGR